MERSQTICQGSGSAHAIHLREPTHTLPCLRLKSTLFRGLMRLYVLLLFSSLTSSPHLSLNSTQGTSPTMFSSVWLVLSQPGFLLMWALWLQRCSPHLSASSGGVLHMLMSKLRLDPRSSRKMCPTPQSSVGMTPLCLPGSLNIPHRWLVTTNCYLLSIYLCPLWHHKVLQGWNHRKVTSGKYWCWVDSPSMLCEWINAQWEISQWNCRLTLHIRKLQLRDDFSNQWDSHCTPHLIHLCVASSAIIVPWV